MTGLKGRTARTAVLVAVPAAGIGRRKRGTLLHDNRTALLMIAPMAILLAVFVIYPLIYAFYLSSFEISFYREPVFVGPQFYAYVLDSPRFWNSLSVGLRLALMVVPSTLVLAFVIATVIRGLGRRMAGILKTTVYIPTVISAVVASIVFIFMYRSDGGLINGLLSSFDAGPFAFLADPDLALPAVSLPAIWLALGVTTLIMLAGMNDIPNEYYEAAELEGAGFLQKTVFVTIPLLKNILLFLLVTGFIVAVQQVDLPLVMTAGGPLETTTTPNLFVFNQFKDPTPYATSFSLTAALILFFVLGTITAVIFRLVRSDKAIDG